MTFYKCLVQVVVRNQAIVFNMDNYLATMAKEVNFLEDLDQVTDPEKHVNTGFIHMISNPKDENKQEEAFIERKRIHTNDAGNLCFSQEKRIWRDKRFTGRHGRIQDRYSGMLYRTFTELDLLELRHINRALRAGLKTHQIDIDTILSTFEGHTIFSIYFDNIQVYEQILEQLDAIEFPEETGLTGNSIENH